jgi:hypothetical protein
MCHRMGRDLAGASWGDGDLAGASCVDGLLEGTCAGWLLIAGGAGREPGIEYDGLAGCEGCAAGKLISGAEKV